MEFPNKFIDRLFSEGFFFLLFSLFLSASLVSFLLNLCTLWCFVLGAINDCLILEKIIIGFYIACCNLICLGFFMT